MPGEVESGHGAGDGDDEAHGVLVHPTLSHVEELVLETQQSLHLLDFQVNIIRELYTCSTWISPRTDPVLKVRLIPTMLFHLGK